MSRYAFASALTAVVLLTAACGAAGSGDLVTENRDVGNFESIDVSAGIDVVLTIDAGADPSVSVTYDDNVIDDVETRVSGTTLNIRYRENFVIRNIGGGRIVEVTMPSVQEIELSGGSDLTGSGEVDTYRLTASGGSDADLEALEAQDVVLDVSGGSDVRVFASSSVEGEASGGSDVTVYGGPERVLIDTSGGSDVNLR